MRDVKSRSGARMFIFDSPAEIESYVDPNLFIPESASFTGGDFESWDDVIKRQTTAWEEGMDTLGMCLERLEEAELPEIRSRKAKTEYKDEGQEFDYERYMQGEKPFKETKREESEGPGEVTIITDTTTPSHYAHTDILWRGAVALALTKKLEEKGYHVELWVVNGSDLFSGRDFAVHTACCLKRSSDPLDISTLTNTVSGWFYRTATFSLLRTICHKTGEHPASGLGRARTPAAADLDEISRDPFRIYSSGAFSFSGAMGQIAAELARIKKDKETT